MSDKVFLGHDTQDPTNLLPAERALQEVLNELSYQKRRWSSLHDQRHTAKEWALIASNYAGKVATCAVNGDDVDEVRKRLAQLAAVCLSALEFLKLP
jgi:hypothetical protein